jgi:uncharacterized membrane protein
VVDRHYQEDWVALVTAVVVRQEVVLVRHPQVSVYLVLAAEMSSLGVVRYSAVLVVPWPAQNVAVVVGEEG